MGSRIRGGGPARPGRLDGQDVGGALLVNDGRNRILAVGVDRVLFQTIAPLLDRSALAVDRVPRGESALALCQHVGFDLMIVGHPLPDMPLEQFLAGARRAGSPSARAPLVVLSAEAGLGGVTAMLQRDDVAVSIAEPGKLLDEVVTRLLKAPPRTAARLLVRVEVALAEGKQLVMCQSENISEVGMLLRTERLFPLDARLSFEFTLPGDRTALKGRAEVKRHTIPELEKVKGVGVKFVELRDDELKRLRDYVKTQGPRS